MPAMETDFHVSVQDADAYRNAIRMAGNLVPSGFIMRLLAEETVKIWLRDLFGEKVPIHLKQSCEILAPIEEGQTYKVLLSCANATVATPVLQMEAGTANAATVLKLEITFALIEANR